MPPDDTRWWPLRARNDTRSTSSVRVWSELAGQRKVEDRLLGEYHLGLASGIHITLGATGHAEQQDGFALGLNALSWHRHRKRKPDSAVA